MHITTPDPVAPAGRRSLQPPHTGPPLPAPATPASGPGLWASVSADPPPGPLPPPVAIRPLLQSPRQNRLQQEACTTSRAHAHLHGAAGQRQHQRVRPRHRVHGATSKPESCYGRASRLSEAPAGPGPCTSTCACERMHAWLCVPRYTCLCVPVCAPVCVCVCGHMPVHACVRV